MVEASATMPLFLVVLPRLFSTQKVPVDLSVGQVKARRAVGRGPTMEKASTGKS